MVLHRVSDPLGQLRGAKLFGAFVRHLLKGAGFTAWVFRKLLLRLCKGELTIVRVAVEHAVAVVGESFFGELVVPFFLEGLRAGVLLVPVFFAHGIG